jgi:hypothetical protein
MLDDRFPETPADEADTMAPAVFLALPVPTLDADGYARPPLPRLRTDRLRELSGRLCDAPDLTMPGATLMVRLSYAALHRLDPGPIHSTPRLDNRGR